MQPAVPEPFLRVNDSSAPPSSPFPPLFQQILDSLPQAIAWTDTEATYAGCNRAFARVAGQLQPWDIVGKPVQEVAWPPTLEARHTPLYDAAGRVVGQVTHLEPGTSVEDTSQSSAAAALQQSEARFRRFSANLPGMLYQLKRQPDGTCSFPYVNAGSYEIYELSPEEIQASASLLLDTIHADDRSEFDRSIQQSATSFEPWQWEGRLVLPSGKLKCIKGAARPERQPDGSIIWHGLMLDVTRRHEAEIELQKREEFLRSIYDGVELNIYVIDITETSDFQYVGLNPLTERTLGMTTLEIQGKTPEAVFGPEIGKTLRHNYERCLRAGTAISYEECLTLNGVETWAYTTLSPLHNRAGEIYRIIGTSSNITALKQAELALHRLNEDLEARFEERTAALRDSEARLRAFFDNLPFGLWACDLDCRYVMQNSADISDWGNHIGKRPEDMNLPPEVLADWQMQNARVLAGEVLHLENEYVIDGKPKICFMILAPVRSGNKILGTLGANIDITAQKQIEAALRASEQQLREQAQRERLLNCLIGQIRNSLDFDTILTTTLQEIRSFLQTDRCQFAWYHPEDEEPFWEVIKEARRPDAADLTGTYPASVVGPLANLLLNLEILRVDDIGTVADPLWQRFVRLLGMRSVLVIPMQMQNGRIGVISCSNSKEARLWAEEEVELLQAIMGQLEIALTQADLYTQTESKAQQLEQALRELQQTQSQMIQSEKMSSLGQLVAGIAHEINNPVNFIYGNLKHADEYAHDLLHLIQLYQHHYPNPASEIQTEAAAIDLEFLVEDLPKLLTSMRVGAERIQKIVLSLRNFSRMDEAEVKSVNIHEGIDSTLMILQNRIKPRSGHKGVEIIKDYANLPLVECYPGQLNQVFMNILSNALDALEEVATQRDPTIRITTMLVGSDRLQIRITDNGPGMTKAQQQRLFDPFFTTKPVGKGTGLGLSISYQIVTEKHRGSLTCISEQGKGSEFVIEIPT